MKVTKQITRAPGATDQYTICVKDNKTGEEMELSCGLFLIAANAGRYDSRDTKSSVYVGGCGSIAQFSSMLSAIDNASRFHFGTGATCTVTDGLCRAVPDYILSGY